jgi:hypothetical protein
MIFVQINHDQTIHEASLNEILQIVYVGYNC